MVALCLLTAVVGCGARSELEDLVGGVDVAPSPRPLGTCIGWKPAGGPVRVSQPLAGCGGRVSMPPCPNPIPAAAVGVGDGFAIGYPSSDSASATTTFLARVLHIDGSVGAEHALTTFDSGMFMFDARALPMWFATGGGRVGALVADAAGNASFLQLDDAAAPRSSPVPLSGDPSRALAATSTGFSVLQSVATGMTIDPPPVTLTSLDGSGQAVASRLVLPAAERGVAAGRSSLDDGSFMLHWTGADACAGCFAVVGQHRAEDGAELTDARTLLSITCPDFGEVFFAAAGDSMLVVAIDPFAPFAISAAAFDSSGRALGAARQLAAPGGSGSPTLTVAGVPGGGYLVAWSAHHATKDRHVDVLPLDEGGAPLGATMRLTDVANGRRNSGHFPTTLVASATADAGVIAYDAPSMSGQAVRAVLLKCVDRRAP